MKFFIFQAPGEVSTGPIALEKYYQPVYAKFHVDNETLSQVKFEILSNNYKLSLLKERFESGKYFCNNDQSNVPTTVNSTNTNSSIDQPKKPSVIGNLTNSIGSTVDVLTNN